MFAYCIDELRYKSKIFQQSGIITAYDVGIVKSDTAIPSHLRKALCTAVEPLENVPDVHKDWHPGSNEMVLDLVHPSLFPVVYGRTRVLEDSVVGLDDCVKRCGDGRTLSVPQPREEQLLDLKLYQHRLRHPYSRKFQWLPCNVEFEGGQSRYVFSTRYLRTQDIQVNQNHLVH